MKINIKFLTMLMFIEVNNVFLIKKAPYPGAFNNALYSGSGTYLFKINRLTIFSDPLLIVTKYTPFE